MKKKLFAVMTAVCLTAAALSACGQKQSTESVTETKADETESAISEESTAATADTKTSESAVTPVPVIIEHVQDTISEDKGENIRKTQVEYKYLHLSLDDETAAKYPELDKTFKAFNSDADSHKETELTELKADYDSFAETYGADTDDEPSAYITTKVTGRALRADSNAISILCDYTDFLGGAHGFYYTYGLNYDTASGKELVLSDVVNDKDAFVKLVSERFVEEYSSTDGYDTLTDAGEELSGYDFNTNEQICWSLAPDCVSLYFAPYTLGSYAQGAQEVSIYFDEAPEVFNEKYTKACEDYVQPITDSRKLCIKTAAGEREAVSAALSSGRYSDYDIYYVSYGIGDTTIDSEMDCYSVESYLVHTGGRNYIYAFQGSDNDYVFLSVVDVDNKTLDNAHYIDAKFKEFYTYGYINDTLYESSKGGTAFTDPNHVILGQHSDALGTYTAYKTYHVGSDGYPVSDDKYFESGANAAFKAVKDIECDMVDKDGNVTGKGNIPAGSYLAVVRTDTENIADIQVIDSAYVDVSGEGEWQFYILNKDIEEITDTDKPMYRIIVDRSDYPFKANGEEEDKLFAGVMYAG